MNGVPAWLQQALSVLHAKAAALWDILAAIASNKPEPARNVIVYTVVLAALVFVIPKIAKLISK